MSTKRIVRMAVLTAAALAVFVIEAQLPSLAPIPGIKLGLANIVTVWALFVLGPKDAGLILLARILLGSLFCGSVTTLIYSLSGGLLCYIVSVSLRKPLGENRIWVVSIFGAMAHNLGQLSAATAVMKSFAIWSYAPVLFISAILTGAFTGVIAQLLFKRLKDIKLFR